MVPSARERARRVRDLIRRGRRPGSPPPRPTARGIDPEAAGHRLRGLVDGLARRRSLGHAVLGVASGDGAFHWIGAAGDADGAGTSMRAETPYFLASVTKLYIATIVLQLREDGLLHFEDRICEHLPNDRISGLHRLGGVDRTHLLTVEHLLSHTSGLPDFLEDRPRGGKSLYEALRLGEDRTWTPQDVLRIAREDLAPRFPPRDLSRRRIRARYSDTNFQLLIAMIEHIEGRSFAETLGRRILAPLGLRQTWHPRCPRPPEVGLPPARLWSRRRPLDLSGTIASSNDLYSTAADALRFMRALVLGEPFRDPATRRLMQRRWNPIMYPLRYGLGMMRYRVGRVFAPGHRAVTLVGHSGASGSWLFHCPELDLVLTGTVDELGARRVPFRVMPRVLRAVCA